MNEPKARNLTWHHGEIDPEARRKAHGHRGATLWFTGLSGSGKSTVAYRVERLLLERGVFVYVLDGDNIRHGLNRDLGFDPDDRKENIRRIGEVTRLFTDAGAVVLAAFVSPYRADRDAVRALTPGDAFVEVHVDVSAEVCAQRDPKGLYKKALAGEIKQFTGVSAPYEPPLDPEVRLDTGAQTVDESASSVIDYLENHDFLNGES